VIPWLMLVLLFVDFSAPFLTGIVLFFLLKAASLPPWKAIAVVTGTYIVYANIIDNFLPLFASSFLLMRVTEFVASVLGEGSHFRSLGWASSGMRWRLLIYPLIAIVIIPSFITWSIQFLAGRLSDRG